MGEPGAMISVRPGDTRSSGGAVRRLLELRARTARLAPLVLYLVSMGLTSAFFLPHLSEIGQWDEASYLYRGWLMLQGEGLHPFATSPLITALYALCALPFRHSPFWFIHTASIARFLLISMLWLSTYLIARRLSSVAFPSILVGLLFVHPFLTGLTQYPSDPLLAALGGLGFWQLLSFHQVRRLRHVWGASALMGLAALARNDGLVLFGILIVLVVALTVRTKDRWRALIAGLVPFLALVGGYILIYGAIAGDFNPGVMERTYDSFEAGHEIVVRPSGEINMTIEAHQQAREAFGTAEENGYSVLRAILRNPQAYRERLGRAFEILPRTAWDAYGGRRFAAVVLVLALRGVVELAWKRKYALLLFFLLWPLHLITSLVTTLFRTNYLLFSFYVPLGLAAVGLTGLLKNLGDWRERAFWSVAMTTYALLGLSIGSKPMIFAGVAFVGICWGTYFLQRTSWSSGELHLSAGLLAFLAAGVMLRAGFPGFERRELGIEAPERALLTMVNTFDRRAAVAAGSPAVVWAADMSYLGLASTDVPYHRPPDEFLDWMISQNAVGIYVDHTLIDENPAVWDRIQPSIGGRLTVIYASEGGEVQVLLIEPEGSPSGR